MRRVSRKFFLPGYSDAQGELYRKELAEAMESVPLGRIGKEDSKQELGDH